MNAKTGKLVRRPARGFSLLELLIVVAITLVIAAIAIPSIVTSVQNFTLRSAASSLSGLIQKTRMLTVVRNAGCPPGATCSTQGYYAVKSVVTGGITYVFIDMDGSGTLNQTLENSNVLVPPDIFVDGTGHPDDSTIQNGVANAVYSLPSFTPRGLPCFVAGGVCSVNSSNINITFLRQNRALGNSGWAAVTVTPAGRVRVWTWDGTNWQ